MLRLKKIALPVALLAAGGLSILASSAFAGAKPALTHDPTAHTTAATNVMTRAGDQAGVERDSGCRATMNADHSVTVRCPVGEWVTLDWQLRRSVSAATVDCLNHPCKYAPTITIWRHFGANGWETGYSVKQLVHANTIASMTATLS